jgi:hypothetical protein
MGMARGSEIGAYAAAAATGVVTWELVRRFGARREPWDSPVFWQLGYPLMIGASLALGLIWQQRPWRWVVALVGAQAAWSLVLTMLVDGVPNLLPLGLIMFALLGLPCLLAAYLGKWVGGWVNG